jgi:hypothetical protein
MKFAAPSLKPVLVSAFALSLFPTLALAQHYQQTNLVSNVPVTPAASVTDPNLLNAWDWSMGRPPLGGFQTMPAVLLRSTTLLV